MKNLGIYLFSIAFALAFSMGAYAAELDSGTNLGSATALAANLQPTPPPPERREQPPEVPEPPEPPSERITITAEPLAPIPVVPTIIGLGMLAVGLGMGGTFDSDDAPPDDDTPGPGQPVPPAPPVHHAPVHHAPTHH